ncbi:hypothetical protein LXL04_014927 [Taraxacum kok-saghyz]
MVFILCETRFEVGQIQVLHVRTLCVLIYMLSLKGYLSSLSFYIRSNLRPSVSDYGGVLDIYLCTLVFVYNDAKKKKKSYTWRYEVVFTQKLRPAGSSICLPKRVWIYLSFGVFDSPCVNDVMCGQPEIVTLSSRGHRNSFIPKKKLTRSTRSTSLMDFRQGNTITLEEDNVGCSPSFSSLTITFILRHPSISNSSSCLRLSSAENVKIYSKEWQLEILKNFSIGSLSKKHHPLEKPATNETLNNLKRENMWHIRLYNQNNSEGKSNEIPKRLLSKCNQELLDRVPSEGLILKRPKKKSEELSAGVQEGKKRTTWQSASRTTQSRNSARQASTDHPSTDDKHQKLRFLGSSIDY